MEWESSPMTMIEQAKEELQILEIHHPNRFDYLKLELISLISQLQSQSLLLSKHSNNNNNNTVAFSPATSSTSTQASSTSNSKKRKKMGDSNSIMKRIVNDGQGDLEFEASKKKHFQRSFDCQLHMKSRERDRNIDAVIAKAQGLEMYGRGDWKNISRYQVLSRTPTQVASHAQKYFLRLNATNKERRRSSIYDITISDDGDTSAPQGPIVGQVYVEAEAGSSNIIRKSMPFTPGASVHDTPAIHMDVGHQLCEGPSILPMMEAMATGSSVMNETSPPIWPNDWSWN